MAAVWRRSCLSGCCADGCCLEKVVSGCVLFGEGGRISQDT